LPIADCSTINTILFVYSLFLLENGSFAGTFLIPLMPHPIRRKNGATIKEPVYPRKMFRTHN
jgi:hypothetical protein